MKRLIHTAVLAAALAFALLLCGCSGAETSHKAPQRAAVESGERQFAQPSDGDFIAIFPLPLARCALCFTRTLPPWRYRILWAWPAAATMIIR